MGTKLKPHKGMSKRFKVTGTGKLKRRHSLSTHLRSARSPKKKRHLGRPAIMFEGLAKKMRRLMGASKKNPNKIAHERAIAAKQAAAGKTGETAAAASA
jgi:large subunit ribosomal protein L35